MIGTQIIPPRSVIDKFVAECKDEQMVLALPTSFDAYLKLVDKDVRTQCRKAQRMGFTARWTTEVAAGDLADIFESWTEKQGRPLNNRISSPGMCMGTWLCKEVWPFSYYPDTVGYIDLIQVYDPDGIVVAFVEIASSGPDTIVLHTMGHSSYLRHGVMKLAFLETIHGLIDSPQISRLYYLKRSYVTKYPEKAIFVRDFAFKEGLPSEALH